MFVSQILNIPSKEPLKNIPECNAPDYQIVIAISSPSIKIHIYLLFSNSILL